MPFPTTARPGAVAFAALWIAKIMACRRMSTLDFFNSPLILSSTVFSLSISPGGISAVMLIS